MAIGDFFKRLTRPQGLKASEQTEPPLKPFPRRRRKKKPELVKQLDRIPADNEDGRARLERLAKWKTRADRAEQVRTDWETDYQVDRCERFFLGLQSNKGTKDTDLVLNHFLATIRVMKPNLL